MVFCCWVSIGAFLWHGSISERLLLLVFHLWFFSGLQLEGFFSGFRLVVFYFWVSIGEFLLLDEWVFIAWFLKFLLVGFHSCVSIDGLRLVGFYWWVFCGWVSFGEVLLLDEWAFIAWFPLVSFYWWVSINVFLLMGFDWWVSIGG